jgi:predicted dehydrogenase
MKVLIVGAGRMGIRHAQGILKNDVVESICIIDISINSLQNAEKQINSSKVNYLLNDTISNSTFDICIIASTANDRIGQLEFISKFSPSHILVEKPLGQSLDEVVSLNNFVKSKGLNCSVNLNMRLYDSFNRIKNDLKSLPQLNGKKTITINTGTVGIGANGIHYLDLIQFLIEADSNKIIAAHIDQDMVPSGRGENFGDFGGWIVIDYCKKGTNIATALISISSYSTAFGSWEILAPNGRIWFNEVDQNCIYSLRKEESTLPISRYYGDYLANENIRIEAPFLGDLTNIWIEGIASHNKSCLPNIDESLPVHQLMFDWLSFSKTQSSIFPIT